MTNFIPFNDWVIFHCIYVSHLLYSFLCWWTFRLCPHPGYCKCCCMNKGVHVCFWIMFFSQNMPSSGIAGPYGSSVFSFLRKLHTRDCHTECSKSEREKQILYINAYMWNLEKWYRWSYFQNRNRDSDARKYMYGHQGGWIGRLRLMYIHYWFCV